MNTFNTHIGGGMEQGHPPFWLDDMPGGPQDVSHTAQTQEEINQLFGAVPELGTDFSDSKTPQELKSRVRIAEMLVKAAILAEDITPKQLESARSALRWQQLHVVVDRFRRQTHLVD